MTDQQSDKDLIFNPHGRRHYRRKYSVVEARFFAAIMLGLIAITAWVVWKGGQPDPTVFGTGSELIDPGKTTERGGLPDQLAQKGFHERELSQFDPDHLYEKIDGRADFFRSRGFVRLIFVKLESERDASLTVDVEFYDMGAPENALGTYASEKAPETTSTLQDGSIFHRDRNALFFARGRFYVRAIGSDESETVLAQLDHLRQRLQHALVGAELPWAHLVFQRMNIPPGRLSYYKENAFSFGFASHVYAVRLADDETEAFVMVTADANAARALEQQFREGFLSYGESVTDGEHHLIKDQYIGSFAEVATRDALVYGVRGALVKEAAIAGFDALKKVVSSLEPEIMNAARNTLTPPQADARSAAQGAE